MVMQPDFEAGEREPRNLVVPPLDDKGAVRPRRVPMFEGEEEALLPTDCFAVKDSVTGPVAASVFPEIIL